MNSLGLIYCMQASREAVREKSFIRRFFKRVVELFKKDEIDSWAKRVDLDDSITMHLIKLPYSIDELAGLSGSRILGMASFISNYCMQNSIGICTMSGKIPDMPGFEGFNKSLSNGRFLYEALLIQILDSIYSRRNISIRELDIAIIDGESFEELDAVISLLSPHVRYMTVLTDRKEQVESELSKVYDETGLSVRVTGDRKSCLKNAGLVINLGSLKKAISGNRLSPGTLLINFRNPSDVDIFSGNTIINGIDVKLPKSVEAILDREIFDFFSACEIAELLVGCKTGYADKAASGIYNAVQMENISKEFEQSGYIISRFIGKYNTLKAGDIKL